MSSINFFTQDIKINLRDKNALRRWIAATAKKEGCKIEALNYIFCSDKFLHRLNEQFLHHDDYTDIITFDLSTAIHKSQTPGLQGEIFISIERVKENAKLFKTTFQNELHRVMIHGALHLIGYKDKTKSDKAAMRKKENYYLNLRSF
ncbi:MAG TPA: rRNA maturation RNase YbeY [Bacteroidia bacterium]|nr:rRNA maturation RNase YbeY [Bacteroidia bacterium]